MGSPQAAHLGASTLWGEQRSREMQVVLLEGKAQGSWEPSPRPGPVPSSPGRRAWLTHWDSLPQASGSTPSANEHIWPLSARNRD